MLSQAATHLLIVLQFVAWVDPAARKTQAGAEKQGQDLADAIKWPMLEERNRQADPYGPCPHCSSLPTP